MKLKKYRGLMSYMLVFIMLMMTLNPVFAVEETGFADVEGHWAEPEITKAYNEQLVEGYPDDTFQPDKEITRAEFLTLMNRFLYLKEMAKDNYLDVKETDWFSDETAKAKQIEYIIGDYARPEESCTREEVVSTLAELLSIQGKASTKTFNDLKGLSEESKRNINGLVEKGYITGYPDETFKPQGTITRAEILKMFNNALGTIVRDNDALNGINEIQGNLTIVNTGIDLEGKTINGDLYISPGALDKLNLKNLKVTGRIIISGGSESTPIKLDNVEAKEITIRKTTGKANIEITGESEIEKITTKTETKIEVKKGTTIKELDIQGQASGTEITGEGKITKATIDAKDVTVEQRVQQVKVTKNAKSVVIDGSTKKYKSSSSSSHSSSGSTETVSVTGVNLSKTSTTLTVGDTETLTVIVAPANAINKNVIWLSSNTGVAEVDSNGQITAIGAGTANITVKTVDGNKTATCEVTVNAALVAINAGTEAFEDFAKAGVTGAVEENKDGYDKAIAAAKTKKGSDLTLAEVQNEVNNVNLAITAISEMAENNNADDLEVVMLETAGVTDVVERYLNVYRERIVAYSAEDLNNLIKIQALIDVLNAYERVDETFPADITVTSGATITLTVPTGYAGWFAPAGINDNKVFSEGPTMTTAPAGATSIKAPTTAGDYSFYLVTVDGLVYEGIMSTLTVSGVDESVRLTYSESEFTEAEVNDGTVDTVIIVTLVNDTFVGANDAVLSGVTVNNVPAGLIAVVTKKTDTTVEISFTGKADAHADGQDVSNLEVVFAAEAFTTTTDASAVTNATKSDLTINFADPVATEFAGGTGTEGDPFQITKLEHLSNVRNYLQGWKHFKLMNNLDFTKDGDYLDLTNKASWTWCWSPIGDSSNKFEGIFNGQGYTISGLSMNTSGEYFGLFGSSIGTIENLALINVSISGSNYMGGLVGENEGTIRNSYTTASVSGGQYVGGLVGKNSGTIKNCYTTGNVRGEQYVGGLAGYNELHAVVYDSGVIENSYATGNVSGGQYVGGLVGFCYENGTTKNSIAFNAQITEMSTISFFNRIVGNSDVGSIDNCYANDSMSLPSVPFSGIEGENMTAGEFKNPANAPLSSWDFTDIWEIKDGADRPTLIGVGDDGGKMNDTVVALAAINAGIEVFEDFAKAGVTGAVEENKDGYDKAIAAKKTKKGSGLTLAEVQSEVKNVNQAIAAISEMAGNNNADTLTVKMLETAGVIDVVEGYLNVYKKRIVDYSAEELNNLIKIQALIDVLNAYERVDETFSADITVTSGATITLTVPTGYTGWFAPAGINDNKVFSEGPTMTTEPAGATSIKAPTTAGDYSFYLVTVDGLVYEGIMSTLTVSGVDESVRLTYSESEFTEAEANDGTVDTVITVTLVNDTFVGANDAVLSGVTVNNVPAGLIAVVTKKTDTTAEISFTGKADAHADGQDVSNLEVVFAAESFATTTDTSAVTNATKSDLTINFADPVVAEFAGGTGTSEDPFQITKLEHLYNVRNYLGAVNANKYFKLMNNLDFSVDGDYLDTLTNKPIWTTGEGWNPIGSLSDKFNGNFDGDVKTITKMYINRNTDYVGLFGYTQDATIKNIEMINKDITGKAYVGGLIGFSDNTIVEKCSVEGTDSTTLIKAGIHSDGFSSFAGGLIGNVDNNSQISDSYSTINIVVPGGRVGGLVGGFGNSTIKRSFASGNVTGGNVDVGGLVAGIYKGTIENSYATGDVSGKVTVGGLIGWHGPGNIKYSYAAGSVDNINGSSSDHMGGITGWQDGGIMYNTIALNPSITWAENDANKGRVVGLITNGQMHNAYIRTNVILNPGYTVSEGINTKDGQSKDLNDMNKSFYETDSNWYNNIPWDFTDVWEWKTGAVRPTLIDVGNDDALIK